MLISPPSLRHSQQQQSDADWLASILPDLSVGRYPLSTRFEWHGGIHVLLNGSGEANTVAPLPAAMSSIFVIAAPVNSCRSRTRPSHASV